MNIAEFKKGDKVVRVEPAKSLGPMMGLMGEVIERGGDRSYIGDQLTFLGIANGCAYFAREEDSFGARHLGKRLDLRLDIFSDGWDYWQDIDSIGESNADATRAKLTLKEEVQRAMADEDYELIAELKELFDRALAKG